MSHQILGIVRRLVRLLIALSANAEQREDRLVLADMVEDLWDSP